MSFARHNLLRERFMAPSTAASIPPPLRPYLESLHWNPTPPSHPHGDADGPVEDGANSVHDLILVTQLVSYSANWILLRFLQHALHSPVLEEGDTTLSPKPVILLSFMHDFTYWNRGLSRLGIDAEKARACGAFNFIDGMSLDSLEAGLLQVQAIVHKANAPQEVLVLLDSPDVLVAATEGQAIPLLAKLTATRRSVRALVCTVHVDINLGMKPTRDTLGETPLETQQRTFVLGLATVARMTIGVRGLDSGAAKDVSGVLTVARGVEDWDERREEVQEGEWLYFIRTDGGSNIFRRGEGVG